MSVAFTSYTTSKKCGLFAGMLEVNEDSFPTVSMLDIYREDAFGDIYEIAEVDADGMSAQQLRIAAKIEKFLVKIMADNIRYKTNFVAVIPDQYREQLESSMGIIPIDVFSPGKDT